MLCQHLVQKIGMIMEREADFFHQSLGLFLFQPGKAVQFRIYLVMAGVYVVQQIVIKIADAGLFPLFVKNAVTVFPGLNKPGMQFGSQGKAIPGMTVHQSFFCSTFALEPAVHPRGIKVSKPTL